MALPGNLETKASFFEIIYLLSLEKGQTIFIVNIIFFGLKLLFSCFSGGSKLHHSSSMATLRISFLKADSDNLVHKNSTDTLVTRYFFS